MRRSVVKGSTGITHKAMPALVAKMHDLLSEHVFVPSMRLRRLIKPGQRPAIRAYYAGMRFRRETADWSEERKRQWILERLRFVVRRAARETLYYSELFKRTGFDPDVDFSFDDFARLPILEREEMRQAGRELVSCVVPANLLRKDATGGSTGVPTEVWKGPEEIGWGESAIDYFMERIEVPVGARTAYFWGHNLDPVARDSWRARLYDFQMNVRWFDCFRLSPEVLNRYHHEFESWRPACIIAYASALGSLAEHVIDCGYHPNYPAKCFVTGAEKLMPKHREMIERAFSCPVHERYGGRDVGMIGFQLEPASTLDYTIDWANVLIEPETSDAVSSILVTKLHADGMPMIRYRVGDLGRFPEGSRPGYPTFALREVLGREMDRIWLPEGRWVHSVELPHLMKDHPVREWMLFQRADYSVEVRIVTANGFGQRNRDEILSTLRSNLPGVRVTLEEVNEIPRTQANKLRPVVSEIERVKAGSLQK